MLEAKSVLVKLQTAEGESYVPGLSERYTSHMITASWQTCFKITIYDWTLCGQDLLSAE